jgi:hypothetical protein
MELLIGLVGLAGLVLGVAVLFAQLRLFKISDTLDQILQELRRRPQ